MNVGGSAPAPDKASQVARGWDEAFLKADVLRTHLGTKAATEPSSMYDCVVSQYELDGTVVTTKQTFSVWLAEFDNATSDTEIAAAVFKLLNINHSSHGQLPKLEEVGVQVAQKLLNPNAELYALQVGNTDSPDWRSTLRIVHDGKKTFVWALKLTGQPMAAVIGYSDKLNQGWFARLR
jgi:hypothetical protein